MDIVILDLEWNSAYCAKAGHFINEILEFGAVKLDENLNETDRFQCMVRSALTKRLRGAVKKLTSITNDEMRNGIPLSQAIERFTEWAGKSLLLTWSDSDIHVLIENCKVLLDLDAVPFLYYYADVQKYIMKKMGVSGNQVSLSNAAGTVGVDIEQFKAHRALGDSLCCAEILRKYGVDDDMKNYIVDATAPDYYKRFLFKSYPISDLKNPLIDRDELFAMCPVCGKKGEKLKKWKYKNRNFTSDFFCTSCGKKFVGRVRFIKTYDGVNVYHNSAPFNKNIIKNSEEIQNENKS